MITGVKNRKRDTCQGADHKAQGCSSKYVGVDVTNCISKWRSYLGVDNIKLYLGNFKTEVEAAQVYNYCALYFYGEDAKLNDVPTLENNICNMDKILARHKKYTLGKKKRSH